MTFRSRLFAKFATHHAWQNVARISSENRDRKERLHTLSMDPRSLLLDDDDVLSVQRKRSFIGSRVAHKHLTTGKSFPCLTDERGSWVRSAQPWSPPPTTDTYKYA